MSQNCSSKFNKGAFDLSHFEMDLTEFVTLDKYRGKQELFFLQGEIMAGELAQFMIDSSEFSIGQETWIFGDFKIGASARVEGTRNLDGCRYARKIVVIDTDS